MRKFKQISFLSSGRSVGWVVGSEVYTDCDLSIREDEHEGHRPPRPALADGTRSEHQATEHQARSDDASHDLSNVLCGTMDAH